MPDFAKRKLPSGTAEGLPLAIGIVGIAIPVSLLAVAAGAGSTIVLIFAVLAMFLVGAGALTFILLLASDTPDNGSEPGTAGAEAQAQAHGETHAMP